LYGILPSATTIDAGLHYLSAIIGDVPAVWVNANAVERTVNVYYVNTDGSPIGTPNFKAYPVTVGNSFTLNTSDIPNILGHEYKEWKKGLSGKPQTGNFPSPTLLSAEVIAGTDIYLIFEAKPADVTVSKTVTGLYANKLIPFTFMVQFLDNNNNFLNAGETFAYEGGALPNTGVAPPANDTLTLSSNGTATFTLKHGQTITIIDIPSDYQIKFVETPDSLYDISYKDSGDPLDPGDKEMDYKIVGAGSRRFDFVNERKYVPPMGIDEGDLFAVKMLLLSLLLISSGTVILMIVRKKTTKSIPK
jgi:hypothetical protein